MKTTVKIEQEIDIKYLHMELAVRYDEEDMPRDFFGRHGDVWIVDIDIDAGTILNWPQGLTLDLHMKVVDTGCYYLQNVDKQTVAEITEDYVPHGLVPGQYGDYVIMQVDESGKILNWPKKPKFDDFFPD